MGLLKISMRTASYCSCHMVIWKERKKWTDNTAALVMVATEIMVDMMDTATEVMAATVDTVILEDIVVSDVTGFRSME